MTFREYRKAVKENFVGFWKDMFYQAGDMAKTLRNAVKFVKACVVAALLMVAYLTVIAMPIIILGVVLDMGCHHGRNNGRSSSFLKTMCQSRRNQPRIARLVPDSINCLHEQEGTFWRTARENGSTP